MARIVRAADFYSLEATVLPATSRGSVVSPSPEGIFLDKHRVTRELYEASQTQFIQGSLEITVKLGRANA